MRWRRCSRSRTPRLVVSRTLRGLLYANGCPLENKASEVGEEDMCAWAERRNKRRDIFGCSFVLLQAGPITSPTRGASPPSPIGYVCRVRPCLSNSLPPWFPPASYCRAPHRTRRPRSRVMLPRIHRDCGLPCIFLPRHPSPRRSVQYLVHSIAAHFPRSSPAFVSRTPPGPSCVKPT
ncbi:hypothetical protein OH77DRAFT_1286085 [Trametes cingulata]|nr:hypothetical protein OH77DRAFT_1286085 [Trametes cingulata]